MFNFSGDGGGGTSLPLGKMIVPIILIFIGIAIQPKN